MVLLVDDGQHPIVGVKIDRRVKRHRRRRLLLDMSQLGSAPWTVLSAVGAARCGFSVRIPTPDTGTGDPSRDWED
jgi:hypothetical protein